jgi:alkyl hydroperoxide reductase subunit AhpF
MFFRLTKIQMDDKVDTQSNCKQSNEDKMTNTERNEVLMRYDTVIVGNGPAGLSAAIYAQRAGLSSLVIAESPVDGGQIATTYEVDNYPGLKGISGMELGMKFREHANQLDTEFLEARLLEIEDHGDYKSLILDQGEAVETKTVILALGADHRKLGVPGEKELIGSGVDYILNHVGHKHWRPPITKSHSLILPQRHADSYQQSGHSYRIKKAAG